MILRSTKTFGFLAVNKCCGLDVLTLLNKKQFIQNLWQQVICLSLHILECIDFGQQLTSIIGSGEMLIGCSVTW